jgi:hypothetical protein
MAMAARDPEHGHDHDRGSELSVDALEPNLEAAR